MLNKKLISCVLTISSLCLPAFATAAVVWTKTAPKITITADSINNKYSITEFGLAVKSGRPPNQNNFTFDNFVPDATPAVYKIVFDGLHSFDGPWTVVTLNSFTIKNNAGSQTNCIIMPQLNASKTNVNITVSATGCVVKQN